MATVIVVLILILICIYAVRSYLKKLSSGCCGAGGDVEKKIRVRDKNPSNYPYCVEMSVDGMTCSNCKRRVENALNAQEGVWAEVDLSTKSATVHMKQLISVQKLRSIVARAGYRVIEVKTII